ncbi:hypothetical protein Droror1_Dr00011881 [Drosera rotundifolia]
MEASWSTDQKHPHGFFFPDDIEEFVAFDSSIWSSQPLERIIRDNSEAQNSLSDPLRHSFAPESAYNMLLVGTIGSETFHLVVLCLSLSLWHHPVASLFVRWLVFLLFSEYLVLLFGCSSGLSLPGCWLLNSFDG